MSDSSRLRQLTGDMFIFIIGTVLAKAIQFLLMPLYTAYMTPEAYGTAELTNNFSELLFPAVTLCIYEAAFRYAVDPKTDNGSVTRSVARVMGVSMLFGIGAAAAARYVFHYEYAYCLYFVLYAYSLRMCAAYYVRGKGMSKVFAVSGIVNAAALALLSYILLVRLGGGVRAYLLAIAGSFLVSFFYLVIRGLIGRDLRSSSFDKETHELLLKYGVPLIAYNLLYWFTTISGRYILLWFTDPSTAGLYVAAIKIAAVINMIQQAVYAAFQLNTSMVYEEEGEGEKYFSSVINLFISLYCVFGAPIICMSSLIAKFALRGDFYEARIYLPLIMFSAILACISSLVSALYSTYKKTGRKIGVSLTGACVNVLAGLLLAPRIGIWGICIASALCFFSQTVYMYFDVRSFCRITYRWKTILPDLALLTAAVVAMSLDLKRGLAVSIAASVILLAKHTGDIREMIRKLAGKEDAL